MSKYSAKSILQAVAEVLDLDRERLNKLTAPSFWDNFDGYTRARMIGEALFLSLNANSNSNSSSSSNSSSNSRSKSTIVALNRSLSQLEEQCRTDWILRFDVAEILKTIRANSRKTKLETDE